MASPARIYKDILDEHRRRMIRLADRHGVANLKKLYDDAQAELERRLHEVARRYGNSFTAHQHRVFLAQIRQGQSVIARRLAGALGDVSREAQVDSLRGLISDMTRLERKFTGAAVALPVEEASRFRGVIDGRRQSLLRAHEASMANYGAAVVASTEDALGLSLATGENASEAIDRVMDVTTGEWWQAERIVRTEVLGAFNATYYDGLAATAEEIPDIMMRWVEHVDDTTYTPLDDRVGDDSVALHGQVAPVGGVFTFPETMPGGGPVNPKTLERMQRDYPGGWMFPPNRPNDRATLSAWRPHWGVSAWRCVDGQRIPMKVGRAPGLPESIPG